MSKPTAKSYTLLIKIVGGVLIIAIILAVAAKLISAIRAFSFVSRRVAEIERYVGSSWRLSPDRQYLVISSSSPSYGSGRTVYDIDTEEFICSIRDAPGASTTETNCGLLPLRNGLWWSPWNGLTASRQDSFIGAIRTPISAAPNGKWLLTGSETDWSLINLDSLQRFDVVFPGGYERHLCAYQSQAAWSADSKKFAILYTEYHRLFIWRIDDQGGMELVENTAGECTTDLYPFDHE